MTPRSFQAVRPAGQDRWMVSYLDVLTILLIFFVAVAAKSREVPASPAEPRQALAEIQRKLPHGLDTELQSRGLVIGLPRTILFAAGDDRINAAAVPIVEQIAQILREVPNKIVLAGYADAVPIHNRRFRSNWELAAARSLRLLELLKGRYGIEEARLSVASYGSLDPRNENDTPEGRATNRRVEIVILGQGP